MAVFVVLADVALTVRFNVAIESQPDAPVVVYVYVPAALIDCPFQLYGNCDGQIAVFVVLVLVALIVTINVATESHPFAPVSVAVYVPAALIDCEFQAYGN